MNINLAGLSIGVEAPDDKLVSMYAPYLSEAPAQFSIQVTESELNIEAALAQTSGIPQWEVYGLATFRKLCHQALAYDCLLFHSSAVAVDGRAYLFAAPSGTGKSTHTRLWRELFGKRAVMINDDKPLLRLIDGVWLVCGTPWNGKHGLGSNRQVPIQGICFLEQADHNKIIRLDNSSAIPLVLNQMLRFKEMEQMDRLLCLTEQLMNQVPIWRLSCLPNHEAANLCYQTMKGSR